MQEELPQLAALHRDFGGKVEFLGLSWDRFEEFDTEEGSIGLIEELADEAQAGYDSLLFIGTPYELFDAFQLEERLIPQTFL